jgi:hypothetical protein
LLFSVHLRLGHRVFFNIEREFGMHCNLFYVRI